MQRLVAAARRGLSAVPAVRLRFGPAVVHAEGVLLEGEPADPVAALRTALRSAARKVGLDPPGADDERVWPHLSLAYSHASRSVDAVLAAVAGVPSQPIVETFTAITLIVLRREDRGYTWTTAADVPLGR